jgi:hypothetical protein
VRGVAMLHNGAQIGCPPAPASASRDGSCRCCDDW